MEYHEFLDMFLKKTTNILSSHKINNYHIKLKINPRKYLKHISLYEINIEELLIVKKYLENNLLKGFIKINSSLIISSILFIRKLEEELRFYINYYKFNAIIKKNRYSIPLIKKIMI